MILRTKDLKYVNAVMAAMRAGHTTFLELNAVCPDCQLPQTFLDHDRHLVVLVDEDPPGSEVAVVIDCEGYWVVNPAAVGIESPHHRSGANRGMNATTAIESLCAQLGVSPAWARLNTSPPSPLIMRLTMLAGRLAAGMDLDAAHLDTPGVTPGQDAATAGFPCFGQAARMTQLRDQAVNEARQLLGDLLAADLVR